MPTVAPSITAYSEDEYRQQMEKVASYAERLHIDLMDGDLTKKANIAPDQAWWPVGIQADFHLMYKHPDKAIDVILEHQPNMVIIHSEADGNFESFATRCHHQGVKVGVAVLQRTPVETILPALHNIDHVLIFSGDLGSYGGHANLDLLRKAETLRHQRPDIEIGWDGGVSDQNIARLAAGGVDVFNVGGYLQNSSDAEKAYIQLQRIADETGTT
jgi:ribulose-phosphate 3-epimerase